MSERSGTIFGVDPWPVAVLCLGALVVSIPFLVGVLGDNAVYPTEYERGSVEYAVDVSDHVVMANESVTITVTVDASKNERPSGELVFAEIGHPYIEPLVTRNFSVGDSGTTTVSAELPGEDVSSRLTREFAILIEEDGREDRERIRTRVTYAPHVPAETPSNRFVVVGLLFGALAFVGATYSYRTGRATDLRGAGAGAILLLALAVAASNLLWPAFGYVLGKRMAEAVVAVPTLLVCTWAVWASTDKEVAE